MKKPLRPETIWKLVDNWDTAEVLDCGSSNGSLGMRYYLKHGLFPDKVTAVDIDPQALAVLEAKGVSTVCMDLEKDDLIETLISKYDLILCCEVLEHITWEAEKEIIDSFMKMLNQNGTLVISFPLNAKVNGKSKAKAKPHIRQPFAEPIEKLLTPYFEFYTKVEMNYRTQLLLFSGRK